MTKPILRILFLLLSLNFSFSQDVSNLGDEKSKEFLNELQRHYSNGEYQLHKDLSDSLLLIAKEYKLPKMHVLALVNQAVFYNLRSQRLKAIGLYHEALEQCQQIPEDFRVKTVVLVNMGNTYNSIGSYEKAIVTMKEVLVIADSTENSDMLKAAALMGLANNYAELENYEKTLEYARKTKILGEKTKNEPILASALNSMIDANVNIKKYEEALLLGERALKLTISEKATKRRGWLLLNMGIANYHLEKLDTSLDYLKECVALAKEKGLFEIEMYGHEFLAKVYEQKNNFEASYTAQKEYSLLREKFLRDKKDASNADLEKDINSKEEIIVENNEELLAVSNKRKRAIIWGGVLLTSLIGLLLFYIKRKKVFEIEQTKLRTQYLTLQQTINNEKSQTSQKQVNHLTEEEFDLKPYRNSSLTPEKRATFKKKILVYMSTEKPFLNPDLSQSDLAAKIGISSHHFSEVLHYGFEQNFYNLINSYRVLEAQKLMRDKKYSDAKIIAIAFDSGFKNKNSFNRVFKKYSGQTPSEFRANN